MKTELTKEESQHLLDLGVPKEKASDTLSEGDGYFATTNYYPIFKLKDFLNGEILPKTIKGDRWELHLNIHMSDEGYIVSYKYNFGNCDCIYNCKSEELLYALYGLTVWYYDKYLNCDHLWKVTKLPNFYTDEPISKCVHCGKIKF